MRIPVAFGQYVPTASPIHTLDAKAKMGIVAAFTGSVFFLEGFMGLAVVSGLLAAAIHASRVPGRIALRGVRALGIVLGFTLLAHGLTFDSAAPVLVRLGPVGVDGTGLLQGVFFSVRIVLLVVGTSLLTLTTTPVELTDGLERLMRPLERLGFPAGEVAMMLTIALRFIPTTAEEAEKIVIAQTARGARFDEGGPVRRARAYVPVLVPLFVNLFKRADELATAMESRCYRGGVGRTRLVVASMDVRDWLVLLASAGVLASVAVAL
jgi:energy-coupling factor transport system permease protein